MQVFTERRLLLLLFFFYKLNKMSVSDETCFLPEFPLVYCHSFHKGPRWRRDAHFEPFASALWESYMPASGGGDLRSSRPQQQACKTYWALTAEGERWSRRGLFRCCDQTHKTLQGFVVHFLLKKKKKNSLSYEVPGDEKIFLRENSALGRAIQRGHNLKYSSREVGQWVRRVLQWVTVIWALAPWSLSLRQMCDKCLMKSQEKIKIKNKNKQKSNMKLGEKSWKGVKGGNSEVDLTNAYTCINIKKNISFPGVGWK